MKKKTKTKTKTETVERYNVYDNYENAMSLDYTIEVINGKKYKLSNSDDKVWTEFESNKEILTLTNTGDYFKIKWAELPSIKKLDYAPAAYLQIILNFVNKSETHYVYERVL